MKNSHHFKTFLHFVSRNKLYTAINIFGFAASLMFVILLGFYIQKEKSVDSFHEHKERIFRLEHEQGVKYSGLLKTIVENRYPEVEKATRVTQIYDRVINVAGEDPAQLSAWSYLVDPEFFSIFSFPFLEGSPETALQTKYEIVISESFARKVFGNESALGKRLIIDDRPQEFIVGGVLRDMDNTHFVNPDLYCHIINLNDWWNIGNPGITEKFGEDFFTIYIQAKPEADLHAKMADLERHLRDDLGYALFAEERTSGIFLQPLQQVYYHWRDDVWYTRSNSYTTLRILVAIAVIVLVFAVINYVNLSVAQSGFRAMEASMRRLLGGTRTELFLGFISESVIMCALSMLVGLALARVAEPVFQQMLNTDVTVMQGLTWGNVAVMTGFSILLGIVSGLVPALILAGFQPIEVVRGTFRRKTKMIYSKILISFQYCITIILIGCTVTVITQVRFMINADKGFDTDYILFFNNPMKRAEQTTFRDQLLTVAGVEQIGMAVGGPTVWGREYKFQDVEGTNHMLKSYAADSGFMQVFNFKILERTGEEYGLWLNETAYRRLGIEPDQTQYLGAENFSFAINGKVKDFHNDTFNREIGATAINILTSDRIHYSNIYVKLSPADPFGTRDRIASMYTELTDGRVFDGNFMDQWIENSYRDQKQTVKTMGILSGLALLISSLGMLAMATYFARQRAQEIAVRKIFGAMTRQVLADTMASFLKLVGIAFVIAVPIILYVMREWLMGYVYRISLSWTIFAIAGAVTLLIASSTVFLQSLKAANANPVVSLKKQ